MRAWSKKFSGSAEVIQGHCVVRLVHDHPTLHRVSLKPVDPALHGRVVGFGYGDTVEEAMGDPVMQLLGLRSLTNTVGLGEARGHMAARPLLK